MASSALSYNFNNLYVTLYRVEFLQRKSPGSPLKLRLGKLIILMIAASCIQLLATLTTILRFFKGSHLELSEVSEAGGITSVFLIVICRGITILVNQTKLSRLLKDLEELFPVIRPHLLDHHLRDATNGIILKNKVMQALYTFGSVAYVTLPLLQSIFIAVVRKQEYQCRYPFISWYPFDEHMLLLYPFVYCFQAGLCCICILFLFNDDLIFSTSVTQIVMHYQHLCVLLAKLDARKESINDQKLKMLIRYQYAMESLRNSVNEIFSLSTFISFTIIKISMCLFIFAIFHGIGTTDMFRLPMGVLSIMIPVYLRCSNGTDLYEASLSLIDALYEHNWYEGTPKYRKMIAIMMIRANRPVQVQASKLNHISMLYFKEIIVQTYQFIMFLHNFSI